MERHNILSRACLVDYKLVEQKLLYLRASHPLIDQNNLIWHTRVDAGHHLYKSDPEADDLIEVTHESGKHPANRCAEGSRTVESHTEPNTAHGTAH